MERFETKRFNQDLSFSMTKDRQLKKYWGTISFEGRFVITGSEFLQKSLGIDVILQGEGDKKDITIDTKHIRGMYSKFYLEEMSCPKLKIKGWLLKETGHPDYIFYAFWKTGNECIAYTIPFQPLRDWFIKNKENYPLHTNQNTFNKTTGRIIPIIDVLNAIKSTAKKEITIT